MKPNVMSIFILSDICLSFSNSNFVQLEVEIFFRNTVNVNASSLLTNVLSKSAAFVGASMKGNRTQFYLTFLQLQITFCNIS